MKRAFMFAVLTAGLLAPVAGAQVYINEYCNDPFGVTGLDTNSDGVAASSIAQSDDEFVEIVNAGPMSVNISGWTLADGASVRHTFATPTVMPPGSAIVVFGGGGVAAFNALGAGTGVVASGGTTLGLNNTGDTVTLTDTSAVVVSTYTWTSGGADDGDGFSITRNPEGPGGAFQSHVVVSGINHSAGFMNDGTTPYLPIISVVPQYPGNGADFAMGVKINGVSNDTLDNIHVVSSGNALALNFFSPLGGLANQNFAAVLYLYATGGSLTVTTLPGDPAGTGFWLPLVGSFAFVDGFTNPFFGAALVPGGFTYGTVVPPIMAGTSVAIQGACFAPGFNPVNLGLTNCHEFQVM